MQKILIICSAPRSGSSALLKRLNLHKKIALVPEYDIPSVVKALNIPFQKYKFTSSKAWVKNVDRSDKYNQKTKQFLDYIPHPNSAPSILKKIYETTFPKKELEIIGEKYPRFWVLDLQSLMSNKFFETKLLFIFRNPVAVQLSYEHREKLRKKNLDIWSFNKPYEGIIHWLLGWHSYIHNFKHLHGSLGVKYEGLASAEFSNELNAFLQLESNKKLKLNASPCLDLGEIHPQQHTWWEFMSEIVEEWDLHDLNFLSEKYDLNYFRSRYWRVLLRNPKLIFVRGYLRLGFTLLLIKRVLILEKIKHRYKFLSWTIRRVL